MAKPWDQDETEMTLEEAKRIATAGGHWSIRDIESRRRYYDRKALAIKIVKEAGYNLEQDPHSFGYRITNLN